MFDLLVPTKSGPTTKQHSVKYLFLFFLLLSSVASEAATPKKIQVITTIKPLELIAKAVLGSSVKTQLLLPPGTSPHEYQLKPSQLEALLKTNLLIWVGPKLEIFLAPFIKKSHIPNLKLFPLAKTYQNNPHIWLSPKNAILIARAIKERIVKIQPSLNGTLSSNLALFEKSINKEDMSIHRQLKTIDLKKRQLVTFHNAYQYFTKFFNIPIKDVVTISPERSPGTRHLAILRQLFKNSPSCLLVEPEFHPAYIKPLTEDTSTKIVEIDPLAEAVKPDKKGYTHFLAQLTNSFTRCYRK